MPMFDWKCTGCGADLAVIRKSDDGGEQPSLEEVAEAKLPSKCNEPGGHDWRKVYGAVIVSYGSAWGGGPQKGKL
jgi:predicted nucleic acid-binding Zn ribbon protein